MADETQSALLRAVPATTGPLRPLAETAAMIALSTLIGMFVAPRWGNGPIDLLYLPAVLFAATLYGVAMGVSAAIASALAYNYFFTAPVHTLRVSSPQDLATIAMLFLVALVTSQLAARMRREANAARRAAARDSTIAGFARRLLACSDADQIARTATRELSTLFECNAVLIAVDHDTFTSHPAGAPLTPGDMAAAQWSMQAGVPSGRGTATADAGEWTFHPVRTDDRVLAVVGLARGDGTPAVPVASHGLLDSLLDQLALAIERGRLEREAQDVEDLQQRNKVRSALLAAIGQDVQPRLSVIGSGINRLRRAGTSDKETVAAMAAEHARLQSFMTNLLDLGPEDERAPLVRGSVSVDLNRRRVLRDGEAVHLTPKEFAVLAELVKYPDRVLSHAHLLKTAWGPAQEKQVEYLRVTIRSLRQKLEADPAKPRLILNEPAVDYRLGA